MNFFDKLAKTVLSTYCDAINRSGHRIVSAIPERIAFSVTHSGGANNRSITGHHFSGGCEIAIVTAITGSPNVLGVATGMATFSVPRWLRRTTSESPSDLLHYRIGPAG